MDGQSHSKQTSKQTIKDRVYWFIPRLWNSYDDYGTYRIRKFFWQMNSFFFIWPLFWINAVGITICLWNIFRNVYEKLKIIALMEKILEYIKSIGCDSIIYLCLNQLVILIVRYLVFFIPSSGAFILQVKQVVIMIMSMIGLYIAQQIIIKTKLKVLVGK